MVTDLKSTWVRVVTEGGGTLRHSGHDAHGGELTAIDSSSVQARVVPSSTARRKRVRPGVSSADDGNAV
jgi:hypothetical protein